MKSSPFLYSMTYREMTNMKQQLREILPHPPFGGCLFVYQAKFALYLHGGYGKMIHGKKVRT